MESRRQNVSEDRLAGGSQSLKKKSRDYSERIPIDLIFDILLRLPAKSIARFRCVSKPWASILRHPDFTELFLTRSCTQPQLLLACNNNKELRFFSASQPQNLNENSSSSVTVTYLTKFVINYTYDIYSPVSGLFSFRDNLVNTQKLKTVICNPSTGQAFALPTNTKWECGWGSWSHNSFLGYDPVEKQFKVLSKISMVDGEVWYEDFQVLTLGNGELSWRMIECCYPHWPGRDYVCIGGTLYYKGAVKRYTDCMIVCFDVRTEKFRFIELTEAFIGVVAPCTTLVNYNGKLASLISEGSSQITGKSRSFEMYVLEDLEKHEWSKHVYEFPPQLHNVVGEDEEDMVHFVGVTSANEVVLSPDYPPNPFYVFYYSLERKTIRRVEIQGMEGDGRVHTYLNHVENVTLMQAF